MISFIGLSKISALKLAKENDCCLSFKSYRSLRGVDDGDSDIVVRQSALKDQHFELVICQFKTNV
jgi:hypothetical protein